MLTKLPAELGRCSPTPSTLTFLRCESLEVLCVTNNKLEELPHELGRLNKLKKLDVSNNKLTLIPPDIADIETMEKLDISLNPVIKPIDEAARKGQAKLFEYLKSNDYDATYYRQALFSLC